MELHKADIVVSVAGRDRRKLFYVIGTEGAYVLIADGKGRPLEHPKRKKCMHVQKIARSQTHVADKISAGERVLNSELRRDLAVYRRDHPSQNQGG